MGGNGHGFKFPAQDKQALIDAQIVNALDGRTGGHADQIARRRDAGNPMSGTASLARLLTIRARAAVIIAKSGPPPMRPLYVYRKLLNGAALAKWAKGAGITTTLPPADMHVTVVYSKRPVDWMAMPSAWGFDDNGGLTVKPGGPRTLEIFEHGDDRALVLRFRSWEIEGHNADLISAGASSDFPDYNPHVTLTYKAPADFDVDAVNAYAGPLEFGPAIFEGIKASGFDPDSIVEKLK